MSASRATIPADVLTSIFANSRWQRFPLIFGVIGLICLGAAFGLSASNPERFHFSYLVAYMYGLSLALGALFFVIVQFLVKAGWSVVVRRVAENMMGTLPLFAILFVPVAIGLHHTHHHWWHLEPGKDPILDAKAPYLNPTFFFARAVVYLVIWAVLSQLFLRRSVAQDTSGDAEETRRQQWWAPPALGLYALTVTFAAVDWMKSLDPHWFSTIWGVYYFAGSVVALFAMLSLLVLWLQRDGFIRKIVNQEHYHDLGKLLFGFVVFWSYIAFSQYFLIWYANLPEETIWFAHRSHGGWESLGLMLIVGHFAIPFFFLLPRAMKRNPVTLAAGAFWLLWVHYLDLYYLIMPVHSTGGPQPSIVDLLTLVGVVGCFLGAFAFLAKRSALVPVKDPRLAESLAFENA